MSVRLREGIGLRGRYLEYLRGSSKTLIFVIERNKKE